jgi:hypothetical protein
MNYLFQGHGLFKNGSTVQVADLSGGQLASLNVNENAVGTRPSPAELPYRLSWFAPIADGTPAFGVAVPLTKFCTAAQTKLNAAINNTATSLVVASKDGFPTAGPFPFGIRIDSEVLSVTAVTGGTTFTVARTTPVPHSAGATVLYAPLTNVTKMFRYDTPDTLDLTNWSVNARSRRCSGSPP